MLSVKLLRELPILYLRRKGTVGVLENIHVEGRRHTGLVLAFHKPRQQSPFVSWKEEKCHSQLEFTKYLYQEIWTSIAEATGKFNFVEGKLLKLS